MPLSRRSLLAGLAASPALARLAAFTVQEPGRALPSASQRAWQDLEIGMFVHWAPNTWQDKENDERTTPLSALDAAPDIEQWCDVAESMGAKYIVMVAKHVGGFCWWPTRTGTYDVAHVAWKNGRGDLMAELAAACKHRKLGLGVYLSPRDDTHGAGVGGKCADPAKQAAYDAIYRTQLEELLTRYGPYVEIWFDGSLVTPVGDLIAKYARDAQRFQGKEATIRWVGNEDGVAPYPAWNTLAAADAATGVATAMHSDPDGERWLPLEVDVSVRRPYWFWSSTNQRALLTVDQLLDVWYRSVGRGAQLLLNVPPDIHGRIPDEDARRLRAFGDTLARRFGAPLAKSAGRGASRTLRFATPTRLDHVILAEDLRYGERVRGYRLAGLVDGRWRTLGEGSSVGHKRVQPVAPVTVSALRVIATRAVLQPRWKLVAAYATGDAPPADWAKSGGLWADNVAGHWKDGAATLDLTKQLVDAAMWRIRLVPDDGAPIAMATAELRIGGIAQPSFLRQERGRPDLWTLTLTQLGERVELRLAVRGASRGTVLVRRV